MYSHKNNQNSWALMVVSIVLLGVVLRHFPIGTAYAAWTRICAAGAVALGMLLFGHAQSQRG